MKLEQGKLNKFQRQFDNSQMPSEELRKRITAQKEKVDGIANQAKAIDNYRRERWAAERSGNLQAAKEKYQHLIDSGMITVDEANKDFPVTVKNHKDFIKQALAAGKPVPPEVLKDYPELQKPKEIGRWNGEAAWEPDYGPKTADYLESKQKYPWELSAKEFDEFFRTLPESETLNVAPPHRKWYVERARDMGKEIPASVLEDFPDLAPPAKGGEGEFADTKLLTDRVAQAQAEVDRLEIQFKKTPKAKQSLVGRSLGIARKELKSWQGALEDATKAKEPYELGSGDLAPPARRGEDATPAPEQVPAKEKIVRPGATQEVKPVRFEVGKKLTAPQRKSVLESMGDVYRDNNLEKVIVGEAHGDPIYRYPHTPDLFVKSDVTGRMIRHYVYLPDGRIAHPSELFPELTETVIQRHIKQAKIKANQEKMEAKANEEMKLARIASPDDPRGARNAANTLFNKTRRKIEGSYFAQDDQGRIVRVDGKDAADVSFYEERGFKPAAVAQEKPAEPPAYQFKVGDVVMAKPGANIPAYLSGKKKISSIDKNGLIRLEGDRMWFSPQTILTGKSHGRGTLPD